MANGPVWRPFGASIAIACQSANTLRGTLWLAVNQAAEFSGIGRL
jgi:hypothetical protein